jgi:hypothetical protein
MKFDISYDEHKNIINDIMGCNTLPTVGATKKVDPYGV